MICFIHLGKTAGSTFKNVLRRSFGFHHCDAVAAADDGIFRDSDLRLAQRMYCGLWSLCSHHFQDPVHTLSTPLDYVTFLRDPVQRTASRYQHMVRALHKGRYTSVPDFEEWIQTCARNFQIRQISGGEDVDSALKIIGEKFLFVGLTEQYEASLQAFATLSPWPVNTRQEKRNVAPDNSIKRKLVDDPATRRLIEEATKADRELYNRVRDELFPVQLERAAAIARDRGPRVAPDRYRASRLFTNFVYRPAVKLKRRFMVAPE